MQARRPGLPLLFVALLAAVALALVLWPWLLAPAEQPLVAPADPAAAAPVAASSDAAAKADPADTAAAAAAATPERHAAAVAATATTGSLLVRVVWGDDRQPAAGIDVEVHRSGVDSLFEMPRGSSGPDGTIRFADLAVGVVYPQIDRGGHDGSERTEILAGQQAEVTLAVKMGMTAKGRVVDLQGAPVADAAIVLTGWGGGATRTLATSGVDGSFTLRAVATHCHIGARKAGFLPSSMRQFTASDGAEVAFTIVLTAGGASLAGVVLDPRGQPVPDAVVQAGEREQKQHKLPDGASAMAPQAEQVRTDAAGRFAFASVVPGTVPMAARARGLAPWQQDVEVPAGRNTEITVRLLAGVTLFGTVRDAANAPLAKVDVEAGEWQDLGRRSVRSAADGSYRIEGLAAGKLKGTASHDKYGVASTTLQPAPGETVRWDPILSSGLQCRGRVLDDAGQPVKGVMIEARLEQPTRDDHWWGHENTDAEGRFVLSNCREGQPLHLTVRRQSVFPELTKSGVMPGAEELVIRLPKAAWVYIQGTVLGPDDKPLANVHVSPFQKGAGNSPAETADARTGAFRYGPYPPGEYSMHLSAAGFPTIRLPVRRLGPDEVWDTGTLKFEAGGSLVVQLVTPSTPPPALTLSVHDAAGESVERCELTNGQGRAGPLLPGRYALAVGSAEFAGAMHPFEIRAGVETRLDVPVQRGIPFTLVCELPAGTQKQLVQLVVRDAAGAVVLRKSAWPQAATTTPTAAASLLPGEYTVEASLDELRGRSALTVAAPGPASATIVLQPR